MSRGAQKAFNDQQANNTALQGQATAVSQQEQGIANKLPSDLTPEQKQAILRAKLGGLDVGYENAENKAANFASRTGATAGMPELMADQERQRARDKSTAAADVENQFAQFPYQAAQEKASILSGAASPLTSMYGASSSLAGNLSQQAFAPSWWQNMLTAAAGGAGQTISALKG